MRRFSLLLGVALIALIGVILFRTFTLKDVQPTADDSPLITTPLPNTAQHLSEALRIKTVSHHPAMMDTEAFDQFGSWMRETYPQVFTHMEVDTVSTHTLILHWKGKNSNKAVLLMAHQDVVPVDAASEEQWTTEPFGGELIDGYINGRGALDDKGSLVALLEAAEALLETNFTPEHDIYFTFGQDEEVGGDNGAALAADWFEQHGIQFDWVLDEGGVIADGIIPGVEQPVALIGITEKGYVSVDIKSTYEGGHSSMPKDTNALIVLNEAINRLHSYPFEPTLAGTMEGFLAHIGPHSSFTLKMAAANRWMFESVILNKYKSSPSGAALVRTTWAPTIFRAGIKDNVIPNTAMLTCNSRIVPGETVKSVVEHYKTALDGLPVEISIRDNFGVDPSPVSSYEAEGFNLIGSSARAEFADENLLIAPYLVLGATDGRYMYKVSDNVYRFYPFIFKNEDLKRLHGIDERVSADGFDRAVQFYIRLMSNSTSSSMSNTATN